MRLGQGGKAAEDVRGHGNGRCAERDGGGLVAEGRTAAEGVFVGGPFLGFLGGLIPGVANVGKECLVGGDAGGFWLGDAYSGGMHGQLGSEVIQLE